jgi:Icc-related predicted phosphoesterase
MTTPATSSSEARIGRTLAINPGSEYSEGVLRGAGQLQAVLAEILD